MLNIDLNILELGKSFNTLTVWFEKIIIEKIVSVMYVPQRKMKIAWDVFGFVIYPLWFFICKVLTILGKSLSNSGCYTLLTNSAESVSWEIRTDYFIFLVFSFAGHTYNFENEMKFVMFFFLINFPFRTYNLNRDAYKVFLQFFALLYEDVFRRFTLKTALLR